MGTTDLSYPGFYIGQQPTLIARRDGNVDLAYTGELAGQTRFMVRRRVLTPEAAPSLDVPEASASPLATRLGPNPARAGQRIRIEGPQSARGAASPGELDVFDTSGRRVARVPVRSSGIAGRRSSPRRPRRRGARECNSLGRGLGDRRRVS
jgi:hypothetical protein